MKIRRNLDQLKDLLKAKISSKQHSSLGYGDGKSLLQERGFNFSSM